MTSADVLDGRVNVVIEFAPLKPGEYIILTFQFTAAGKSGERGSQNTTPEYT